MSDSSKSPKTGVGWFRTKLLVAMMLIVTVVTALSLFFAQRHVATTVERDLAQEFENERTAVHSLQEIRHAALAERCRALARRSRIHAALEDNALDLLYPSARDELADVMDGADRESWEPAAHAFHARFYRFLGSRGQVISPSDTTDAGSLRRVDEAQLALPVVPDKPQTGFLRHSAGEAGDSIDEVIAMPIVSTETGRPIAALVLGFKPIDPAGRQATVGMISGIWTQGSLYLPAVAEPVRTELARHASRELTQSDQAGRSFAIEVAGAPCLLFYLRLNSDSLFPPAYEVYIYPLTESVERQRRLFWQFTSAGGALLVGAFLASHLLARRLARPVETLAVISEENRAERRRVESVLELTNEELQRSARFSADASHQLKTPVAVLRAGLEELLAGENLARADREEVAALVHQTFRLTGVIEDLLLLSRMDAGQLQLALAPVDLTPLVEGWLDDIRALPDPLALAIETDLPPEFRVEGEKRYTSLILQNLLENARKYNRPGGRIRVAIERGDGWGKLVIGNSGTAIPAAAQPHLFQRFYRGTAGENLPGHGLGLNLARELARLHRGDLRLVRSEADWTEFEARFRLVPPAPAPSPGAP